MACSPSDNDLTHYSFLVAALVLVGARRCCGAVLRARGMDLAGPRSRVEHEMAVLYFLMSVTELHIVPGHIVDFIWFSKNSGRVTTGFIEFTLLKGHLDFGQFWHHHRCSTWTMMPK